MKVVILMINKEKNILNKQKELSGYKEIKTNNNNENSNINDKQGRITKKIIRRKNKSIIINGGDINHPHKKRNQ